MSTMAATSARWARRSSAHPSPPGPRGSCNSRLASNSDSVIHAEGANMRHALSVAAVLCLVAISSPQAQDGPYRAGKEIPIGGEGGWDYLSIDPAAHRLYVSHATHIVVIDTTANK